MTKNEIVGRLRDGGLDASSTNRSAAVYVADAREGRTAPGWFAYRIICDSEATESRARGILSRWYDIEASGNVWRLRSKNRVPLMAIKRGGVPPTPPTGEYMYFEAVEANSTVYMMSFLPSAPNLEYSTDGATWQEWQYTDTEFEGITVHQFNIITLTAVGDRVHFRGDNQNGLGTWPEGSSFPYFSTFASSGKIVAGGNVMSLLDINMNLTVVPNYGFINLFGPESEGDLFAAPDLSTITQIGDYGCMSMFGGKSLESAPAMSSLTIIGFQGCSAMYAGCVSLTAAAAMPAVTTIGESGCENMYGGCTSLASAAGMPAVTTIGGSGCSCMYEGCTSLASAAGMPSLTTIGDAGCEYMYGDCTFDMSNDGTTLNFAFPTPPITTTGDDPQTFATAYDIAEWMGNTTGFTEP